VGVVTNAKVAIALGLVAVAGSAVTAPAGGGGHELFGPAFKSVKVVENGERHALFDETTVRLKFRHEDARDVVVWRGDCNLFGAEVDVTRRRLALGAITGTAVGCDARRHRQDRWLGRFLGSNPKWELRGRRLKLAEGNDRIVFRRH
jgi:heat shock protein HslJ